MFSPSESQGIVQLNALRSATMQTHRVDPNEPTRLSAGVSAGPLRVRISGLILALIGISVAHFELDVASHHEHVLHVALELAYLFPVVAGAVWFGARGGLVVGAGAATLLGAHAFFSWRGQPMENVNQLAMMVVFVVVGAVSGMLVDAEHRERTRRVQQERLATRTKVIEALAALESALGFRHDATRRHGERVAELAVRVGRELGLGNEQLGRLRLAALVHDLGKIGITDDVLLKPQELTPSERRHIEQHPIVAAEILQHLRGAEEIAKIVASHHERLDGSGYPQGLHAEDIPMEARVLAVADVYCALGEPRPYKPALSTPEIVTVMAPLIGTKLDSDAFNALRTVAVHEGCV